MSFIGLVISKVQPSIAVFVHLFVQLVRSRPSKTLKMKMLFVNYTNRYSVFKEYELRRWYRTRNCFIVIKMLYNIAFTKKVINKVMKEQVGLNPEYWGFFKLTDAQFDKLLELGEIDERYIID